jgi:hypothetical protein
VGLLSQLFRSALGTIFQQFWHTHNSRRYACILAPVCLVEVPKSLAPVKKEFAGALEIFSNARRFALALRERKSKSSLVS